MQTLNDLCPGFRFDHHGVNGVCCCGLYWEGEMPPHDALCRPVAIERVLRRAMEGGRAELAREATRTQLRRNGVEQPLAPGLKLRRWRKG